VSFLLRVGDALDHHDVANRSVGNEHLVAVDHIIAAVLDGPRPVSCHVRTGVGFRKGPGANGIPGADRRQIALLLFLRAVLEDGFAAEGRRHDTKANAHVDLGEFLRE
jgi:hypothetical protein